MVDQKVKNIRDEVDLHLSYKKSVYLLNHQLMVGYRTWSNENLDTELGAMRTWTQNLEQWELGYRTWSNENLDTELGAMRTWTQNLYKSRLRLTIKGDAVMVDTLNQEY